MCLLAVCGDLVMFCIVQPWYQNSPISIKTLVSFISAIFPVCVRIWRHAGHWLSWSKFCSQLYQSVERRGSEVWSQLECVTWRVTSLMGFLGNSLLFTTTGDGSSRDAGDVTFTTFISHGGTEALPLLDIPLDSVGQETVEKVGGGGGPGAGGEPETTGQCRLVVWSAHTFPGPAPGPLPHTGTTSYAISQEIYNCFKYGQNRRHSPRTNTNTSSKRSRLQECICWLSLWVAISFLSMFGRSYGPAKSVVMVCPSIYY